MWLALEHLAPVLVVDNYLYLPLCFDPEIAAAIATATIPEAPAGSLPPDSQILLRWENQIFIRTVHLPTVVAAAPRLFPSLQFAGRELLPYWRQSDLGIPPKLEVLVFQVLPHFVRRGWGRQPVGGQRQALRQWLLDQVADLTPGERLAARWQKEISALEDRIRELKEQGRAPAALPAGSYTGSQIRAWLREGAQAAVCQALAAEGEAVLSRCQTKLTQDREEVLLLLTLSQQEQVEFDGFGWQRLPQPGEYLVYKRTGPYLLVDYFHRPYLFPDCRVAVPTTGPFKPFVLERYKHPLLRSYRKQQLICLPEDYQPAATFSAAAVIEALEAGINALYYGYNPRQRNGYHSLDKYGRSFSVLDFEDLRLPADHHLVQGGELEVKNCYW